MKEIKLIEDIISDKIKAIDVYVSEIDEVAQAIQVTYKQLVDISLKLEDEDNLYDSEEYKLYQEQLFKNNLLKEEAYNILRDVNSLYKSLDLLNVELTDTLKEFKNKEYLSGSNEPQPIFIVKNGILQEREKGLYKEEFNKTLEFVNQQRDAIRGDKSTD